MTETIGLMEGTTWKAWVWNSPQWCWDISYRPSERVWAYGLHFLYYTINASSGKPKDVGGGSLQFQNLTLPKDLNWGLVLYAIYNSQEFYNNDGLWYLPEIHMHARTHARTHACMHAHTHTHTHKHTHRRPHRSNFKKPVLTWRICIGSYVRM